MLLSYLDWYREAALLKLDGLDGAALTRRVMPSATTMLGIIKHLADAERGWFRQAFMNEAIGELWPHDGEPDPNRSTDADAPQRLVATYREEIVRSNHICTAASFDDMAKNPRYFDCQLRGIVVHMIEETARHAGHLDILRELTDGRTGD
jgi:hypothetical protein